MYTFKPEYLYSKGIAYGEFFDVATDNLIGYSQYVADFTINGSVNSGDVEGGLGNQLIMCIPDTARLEITATTADASLNNMALPLGGDIRGNGVIETMTSVTAESSQLKLANAAAPLGGSNGPVAYVLASSGADRATVTAGSGRAYKVVDGVIEGFTAVSGNSYCVKYFTHNSSAQQLDIPALFAGKVVRAHFAVNIYAKSAGSDGLSGALYKIRHYYFPRYFFTAGLQDSVNQTTPGTVDLSGKCLSYEELADMNICSNTTGQTYGFIVDEYAAEDSSTAGVDGIYFIGLGEGVQMTVNETKTIPVKYSVGGVLTQVSNMEDVSFSSTDTAVAAFTEKHENTLEAKAAGTATIKASVTNSLTGVTYEDSVSVTVTAG